MNEGINRAEKYKLETEYQITVYFNIMMVLGIDFEKNEKYSWAQKILNNNKMQPDIRIEQLIEHTENILK